VDLRGAHDFRHTFATWLEDAGIPARVIDEVMGHEATSRAGQQRGSAMGAHYRHTTPEMATRAADAIQQRLTVVLQVAERAVESYPSRSTSRVLGSGHPLEAPLRRSSRPHVSPGVTRTEVVGKIIYLRQHYHFGPVKIAMYLERYHDISTSHSGVRRVLKRLDLNRLPASQRYKRHDRRWKRYEKPLPGHRVQIDVKFIAPLPGASSRRKHYQFTAIDDCTRLRVLRIYRQLNQKTAIQFANYVLERLPFRVEVIQTDNGAEFQSQFHYHLLDGVVIDDTKVFNDKREWENFYNYHRPHGGLGDQTPTNDSSSTHRPGCKQPPSVAHLVGLVRRASIDPSAYRSAAGLISFRAHRRHRPPAAWRRGCQ